MSLARELTMGTRRRSTANPLVGEMRKLSRQKAATDVERLRELIDAVAASPRAVTKTVQEAWREARIRYARETGIITPGPVDEWIEAAAARHSN